MDHAKVDQIIDKYQGDAGSLIQALLELQSENRWLPKEVLEKVSKKLGVPSSRIRHVATFYKAFSLTPRGRHLVNVCLGTACHVRGGPRVLDKVEQVLGITPGETDSDSKFSLETVNCLGCCALGPVMLVDGEVHGKLAGANVGEILNSCD